MSVHIEIATNAASAGSPCIAPGVSCLSAALNRVAVWQDGALVREVELCQAHTLAVSQSLRSMPGASVNINGRPAAIMGV